MSGSDEQCGSGLRQHVHSPVSGHVRSLRTFGRGHEGDDSRSEKIVGVVRDSWSQRVARARQLAQGDGPSASLLSSYADLLALQHASFESLKKGGPASGSLERDLPAVREQVPPLLHAIAEKGPERLAKEATALLDDYGRHAGHNGHDGAAIDQLLLAYWHTPSD